MSTAIRIADSLIRDAKVMSVVAHRSVAGQIEYWARIGKCAEENPDMTFELIREISIGIEELNQGQSTEYHFR